METLSLRNGVILRTGADGSLTLKGREVTPELRERLVDWLEGQAW